MEIEIERERMRLLYCQGCVFLYVNFYVMQRGIDIKIGGQREGETIGIFKVLYWLFFFVCICLYIMQRIIESGTDATRNGLYTVIIVYISVRYEVWQRVIDTYSWLLGIVKLLSWLCISLCKVLYVMQRGTERERDRM